MLFFRFFVYKLMGFRWVDEDYDSKMPTQQLMKDLMPTLGKVLPTLRVILFILECANLSECCWY
jgi:hypothetical protein